MTRNPPGQRGVSGERGVKSSPDTCALLHESLVKLNPPARGRDASLGVKEAVLMILAACVYHSKSTYFQA